MVVEVVIVEVVVLVVVVVVVGSYYGSYSCNSSIFIKLVTEAVVVTVCVEKRTAATRSDLNV